MEADEKKAPALARQGNTNISTLDPDPSVELGQGAVSRKLAAQQEMHELAARCLAAGLSVVPAGEDKRPSLAGGNWKQYQQQLPNRDEVDEWFYSEQPYGLGIVCGAVSCGLEVLDLDAKHDPSGTLNARAEAAIKAFAPGLWERLPRETTPSGGLHLYFRSASPAGNLKLARPASGQQAIAETRGEGGFIVCAPTPGYVMTHGSLVKIPGLTADERDSLLAAARSLDESEPVVKRAPSCMRGAELSPLDDYNERGDALELLRSHGWHVGSDGKHLRRPGKDHGWSATWNHQGRRTLCVFSSSTVFDVAPTTYKAAAVYAVLECGGDFSRAAAELRKKGYGSDRPLTTTTTAQEQPPESVTTSGLTLSPGWNIVSADKFCATPPETPPELIHGLLYEGGTLMLSGPSKGHKTYTMLAAGHAIASGGEWLGFKTTARPVIYLNLELQDFAAAQRLLAITRALGEEPSPTCMWRWWWGCHVARTELGRNSGGRRQLGG